MSVLLLTPLHVALFFLFSHQPLLMSSSCSLSLCTSVVLLTVLHPTLCSGVLWMLCPCSFFHFMPQLCSLRCSSTYILVPQLFLCAFIPCMSGPGSRSVRCPCLAPSSSPHPCQLLSRPPVPGSLPGLLLRTAAAQHFRCDVCLPYVGQARRKH